ncbi:MAG: glycosyltransferase family 4 protein [Candidatus Schekmanbacteria bacterium]|nr:glycosyltransferase family 4 protein [Candidatus Schekmanbacteria bacterium]
MIRIFYPVNEVFPMDKARSIQIMNTAYALAENGNQVILAVGIAKGWTQAQLIQHYGIKDHPNLKIEPISTFRLRGKIRFSWNGVYYLFFLIKLFELLRHKKIDIIFVRHIKIANILLKMQKLINLPIVFETHEIFGLTSVIKKEKRLNKLQRIEEYIYKHASALISISSGLKKGIEEKFGVQNIHVIPDAAKIEVIPGSSARENRPGKTICYVGQLYSNRGVDVLIEALTFLDKQTMLYIIGGSPSCIGKYKISVQNLGIEKQVKFCGWVPHCEVSNLMSVADVAIIPYTNNLITSQYTSPLKAFEYMAAKVPIVASDLPSLREILTHKVNAILVPPENPAALASGIRELLSDQNLRNRLSRQAFSDVQQYTWDERAKNITRVLKEVLPGGLVKSAS